MRIGFLGKGGSGKTSLSTLFAHAVAERGTPVWLVDCDVNQASSVRFGIASEHVPTLASNMELIKSHLMGTNPRITSPNLMQKTTPPGRGSNLLSITEPSSFVDSISYKINDSLRLFRTGTVTSEDVGHKCHHYSVGAAELLLTHTLDGRDDLIILDLTAGTDVFASPLFAYLDVLLVIVNPSLYSFEVLHSFENRRLDFALEIAVLKNKYTGTDREAIWDKMLQDFRVVASFRESESFSELEIQLAQALPIDLDNLLKDSDLTDALAALNHYLTTRSHNKDKMLKAVQHYHVINCHSWINSQFGEDLTRQIDWEYSYP
jgi:CO dehydrogenase maturation factor